MIRSAIVAVVLAAALALAACGDGADDASSPQTATTTAQTATTAVAAAGDVDRYCALTRRLDAEGEQFFSGLDEDSSPEEFRAAERRSVEAFADEFEELERVAPRQIRADVPKLLAGIHERAGLQPEMEVSEAQASAAEKRIQAFERRNCGT